jgi:hypothetical protein
MSRVDYQMSPADLRTFDRWHSRGAAILLAALVVMPWLVGIGPNSVRPEAASAAPATATAATTATTVTAVTTATAVTADTTDTATPVAPAPTASDATVATATDPARR